MSRFGVVFTGLILFLVPAGPAQAIDATDIRIGIHPSKTRFVVDLSASAEYRIQHLASPDRVVIDLPEIDWRLKRAVQIPENSVVREIRFGLLKSGASRIVLDLAKPAFTEKSFLLPPNATTPYRLVLDIEPANRTEFLEKIARSLNKQIKGPQVQPPPKLLAAVRPPSRKPNIGRIEKRVIVIDPGHGGIDPGATGRSGTFEKHITLAAAKDFKYELERTGRYRVLLTRDRDVFVRLRDRIAIARDRGADLFISLHADSIKSRKVRGMSVYTLSENASDKEAADLAERENKSDLIAGIDLSHESPEVTSILIDLAQRETMNESARFAAGLVGELRRTAKVLRNGHRFAGFAVLKAPDVPSVLVELGFMSNAQDEQALKDRAFRRKIGAMIGRAIDRYFAGVEQADRF